MIKAMGTVIRLSIEHQHPDTLLQEAEIKIRAWESQFSANDECESTCRYRTSQG